MLYFYFLGVLIAIVQSICFYEDANQNGRSWCTTLKGCQNVPDWFNDRMTSWDFNGFISEHYVFADADCKGTMYYLDSRVGNVPGWYNDIMTSVGIIRASPKKNEISNIESDLTNDNVTITKDISANITVISDKTKSKIPL
ncbi:hypothetical protein K502DRAFT_352834 [Neoconidiobolus thromboides FSU 785]|nr:hypothetical protein K502DRAFT_352834 [Neoconidiobolus thromboides FSU 785]